MTKPQTIQRNVVDMPTIDLGGHQMPVLGFGTWQLQGEECRRAVGHALDLGYRHIDTAQMYKNEEEVGRAIDESNVEREDVFLTTKIWWENLEPDELVSAAHGCLHRLRTDYVDLLLIHWPNEEVPLGESLDGLRRLKAEGKARQIGVSNFTPELLREALGKAPVVCNQVEYHPYLAQEELLEIAREQENFALTAYSPIARGDVEDDETLAEIAETHGKTPIQVTLRWLVQQDRVAAIPKAAKPKHRESNLEIFDFELDDDEMERIHGLARGERLIDPDFAPDWKHGD